MNTLKEQRAEFLIKWFLDVFDGRKAPFPKKAFNPVANQMREWLNNEKVEDNEHTKTKH